MQVRFTARGNFKPLEASLRGLNTQMARSMGGAHQAAVRVQSPINDLNKSVNKGRLGWKQYSNAMRNQSKILREHNALMNSGASFYKDAAGNARVFLDVNRNMTSNLATLGQRLKFTNTMLHAFGRNMISVGKNMQWAGRQVMVGLTIPLGLLAGLSERVAREYDKNVTRIIKVNDEASQAQLHGQAAFEAVSDSIRRQSAQLTDLGASMGFMADETTDLVATFSQMGFVGAQLDALSDAALRLSRTSGTDLQTSIELTRLTAQAFGVELDQLNQKFANLNIVENNTALGLEELANSMPVVAGVASTLGLEIEETAGLLALMKENGIGAREGATALRTGLTRIVQEPTDPAIEAFKTINMSLLDMRERMQTIGKGDTMFFLDELSNKLQELAAGGEENQAQVNNFIGAIGKLVGTRQAPRFISMLKDVADRTEEGTVAHRAFLGVIQDAEENLRVYESELEQVQKSQAGMAEQLKAEMNVQIVRLGQNFLEVGNMIRRAIRDVLKWFNSLDDKVQNTVFIVGGLAAALGPITMLLGIMTNAIGQVITVLTKFLPRISIATVQERALAAAYGDATNAINLETAALQRNAAAKGQALAASTKLTATEAGAMGGTPVVAGRGRTAAAVTPDAAQLGPAQPGRIKGRMRLGARNMRVGAAGQLAGLSMMFSNFIRKIGTGLSKLAPNFVKSFGKMIGGFFGKIGGAIGGSKLGAAAGAGLGKLGGIGAAVAGIGSGPLAAIAAIVTAIASVPILANPAAFADKFMSTIGPALERFKGIWDTIQAQISRIKQLLDSAGGEGSGLSQMATWVGQIAGLLGSIVLDTITRVVELVAGTLGPAFEAIFHLVDAIGSVLTGDWEGAGAAIVEMFKAVARGIINILSSIFRWIGDILGHLPMIGDEIQRAMHGAADAMDEWSVIQSDIKTATQETADALSNVESSVESLNEDIEEGHKIHKQMMDAELVGRQNINSLTEQSILKNQDITGEQKKQLLLLKRRIQLQQEMVRLEAGLNEIAEIERARQRGEATRVGHPGEWISRRNALRERENELVEEMNNLETDVSTVVESVAGNVENAAMAQDDFTESTKDTTAEQEKLEEKIANIEEKIKESEQAAKEWAQQLRSGVGNVINNIADAVMASLEAQEQKMHEQFENRKERAERVADKELERIDAIVAAEEEQEKRRKEWFEAQKARIDYLENRRKKGVEIQEALARGDLEQAALTRIEMRADEERFLMDSLERQEEERKDKRQQEIEDMREAVEKQKQATLDQLDVELESAQKAYDARKRSIELYLRDWKKITPATEAEFRRHLKQLEKNMGQFGVSMHQIGQHYTNATGNTITRGFKTAINNAKRAIAQDNKWKRVGRSVGAKFRAGLTKQLNKLKGDLDKLMSGSNVKINTGSGGTGTNWSGGSQSGVPKGVTKGSTYSGTQGSSSSGSSSSATSSYTNTTTRRGGIQEFHGGGQIDKTKPDMPMLKQDEQSFVLQRGEFVVQRDAVRALGTDYLQRLNEIKRHSGGVIDFAGAKLREAGALGSAAGLPMGGASTMAALKMIEAGGGNPKIKGKFRRNAPAENVGRKAGKQISDVFENFLAFGPMGGPGKAGPQSSASGKWPPKSWGSVAANTAAALNFIRSNKWGTSVSAFAGANRGDPRSDHSWGKAIDSMITTPGTYPNADERQTGWRIANWFLANADAFGTKYVIWDGLIKNPSESTWRKYTRYGSNPGPTLGHFDHPHVSFMHDGGLVGLKDGGKIKFDNTIANLHKGERVLTEPSTKALETAIQQFAQGGGGGNSYHLEVKVDGGNMDEKKLTDEIMKRIDKKEMAKGRKRVVRSNT